MIVMRMLSVEILHMAAIPVIVDKGMKGMVLTVQVRI